MKNSVVFKRLLLAVLIGFAGAAAAFVPPLLIPAVALIAFTGVCWGGSCFAVALVFTAFGTIAANSSNTIAIVSMTAMVVASACLIVFGLRKKLPYRFLALGLAVLCFAGLYCSVGLESMLKGKAPYAELTEGILRTAEAYAAIGTEGAKEVASSLTATADSIPAAFYGILIMISEAAALLTLLLARRFSKKSAELAPMARFREWQLPQSLKIGLPVLAAGVIVLFITKSEMAQTMFYTLVYMLLPIFAAAGLGCMLCIAEQKKRGFFKVFAVAMTLIAPIFTALIGVFDLYSGLRRRMLKVDRLVREAFEKAERDNLNSVVVDFGDGRGPQVIAVRKKRIDAAFFDGRDDSGIPTQAPDPELSGEGTGSAKPDENKEKSEAGDGGEEPKNEAREEENSDHENGGGEE